MNTPAVAFALTAVSALASAQCPTGIDLTPSGFSRPSKYEVAFGQELYFQHLTANEGLELFKWTPSGGITLAADVKPGSGYSRPEEITACCTASGPRIFFSASGTGGNKELWAIDGTPGSLYMVKDIRPGSTGSLPSKMMVVGNRVFFNADDGTHGSELWITDGTDAGTVMVKDIWVGSSSNPRDKVALGDLLLFAANDGNGDQLWVSDGTEPGTTNLGAAVAALTGSSPYNLVRSGDWVYFLTQDPITGEELWKTDGTPGGTTLVSALKQSLSINFPKGLTAFRDGVLFVGRRPGTGHLLLFSDGTAGGTTLVENDPLDAVTTSGLFTVSGDRAFFSGYYFSSGQELWVTDGTDAGTLLVADINQSGSSNPQELVAAGSGVCFVADDGTTGYELWFSNGTQAGTVMLCDIDPNGSSQPRNLHVVAGQLWMTATDPVINMEPHILATPGAHVQSLGGSGGPDFPTLRTGDNAAPVLGTTVDLIAEGGPAGAVGIFYIAFPDFPLPPLTPLMQGGCNWVGLFAGGAAAFAGTSSSSLTYPLPIPNDPAFEGFGAHLQMVWINPGATPLIQLSNGLRLTLDQAAPH